MAVVFDKFRKIKQRLSGQSTPPAQLPFPELLTLEIAYVCNLRCFMCPRHFDPDIQGVLPIELFRERIAPQLHRFKIVNLTGWGETLMHKDLPEMLRACREAGALPTFTTNGLLLKEPLSRQILEADPYFVNISCDASKAETYESVRGKNTFDILLKRMRHLVELRREMGSKLTIEWSFVMMKNNIDELPGAVQLAVDLGVDSILAKHMETAINREDLGNALWNTGMVADPLPEEIERMERAIEKSREIAEGTATRFHVHPRQYARDKECIVKPSNQLFIDYKGNVSSCCFLNKLDVMPYRTDAERPSDDGVMGNISEMDLDEILATARFDSFRKGWACGEVQEACRNCVNVNRMKPGA